MRSGGPGAIRTRGDAPELGPDRAEGDPRPARLRDHAQRRVAVGQHPLAVRARGHRRRGGRERREPDVRVGLALRRAGRGRGRRSAAGGWCGTGGRSRRPSAPRPRPSTRSRRRRRGRRARSAGRRRAARRARNAAAAAALVRSSTPRMTNATGRPSPEWRSIAQRVHAHPDAGGVHAGQADHPRRGQDGARAGSPSSMRRIGLGAVHELGQVHVLGQHRRAAGVRRDGEHAARVRAAAPGR